MNDIFSNLSKKDAIEILNILSEYYTWDKEINTIPSFLVKEFGMHYCYEFDGVVLHKYNDFYECCLCDVETK